ncbi:MAG: GNAT family N-acetyltransferase [Arcobacteraceae bacterium]|jgi:ribosomal-protein-alanine N-acetyltransferase|nr:GNAT family N-acetyltransferase [Arcobacteraceae bacterium]
MIRLATKKDIPNLLEIEYSVFSEFDFRLSKENFIYHQNKNHIYLVYEEDLICGYILFLEYKNSLRIYSIAIKDKYSKKGYGTMLVEFLINLAKQKTKNLILEVKDDNQKAINLYNKLGFIAKKTLYQYYLDGKDGIKMVLRLK